jgi:hypothetical protein
MIVRPQDRVKNIRWKYKLKDIDLPPLKISEGDRETVFNLEMPKLIVGEESDKGSRKFALFSNYMELYRYSKLVRETTGAPPSLYETCPYYMKIHFDIDLKKDTIQNPDHASRIFEDENVRYHSILKPYLSSIVTVFRETFPSEKDILDKLLVFEGHRPDKISFHIVVDGYYLACQECQEFSRLVVDAVKKDFEFASELADFSVYKKNQSFRFLMSCKRGMASGVKEIYNGPELRIPGGVFSRGRMIESSFEGEPVVEDLIIPRVLPRSILSFTIGCNRLTMRIAEPPQERHISANPLSEEDAGVAMEMFSKKAISQTSDGRQAFKFASLAGGGGIICLRREFTNQCKVCEREHEGDNPFLTITANGDMYYHCRRAQEAKQSSRIYVCNIRAQLE